MDKNERMRIRYAGLRAAGLCVTCRNPNPTPEHSLCPNCLEKRKARHKERYDYLKRIGFCVECGKNRAEPERLRCEQCLKKDRKRNAMRRKKETGRRRKIESIGSLRGIAGSLQSIPGKGA